MMTYLAALLTWRNFINLIDILVIWFLIYELMVLVRGPEPSSYLRESSLSLW